MSLGFVACFLVNLQDRHDMSGALWFFFWGTWPAPSPAPSPGGKVYGISRVFRQPRVPQRKYIPELKGERAGDRVIEQSGLARVLRQPVLSRQELSYQALNVRTVGELVNKLRSLGDITQDINNLFDYLQQQQIAIDSMFDLLSARTNELPEAFAYSFFQNAVAASQTNIAITGPTTRGVVVSHPGSGVRIAAAVDSARTAGTLTIKARKNGVDTALITTIDVTNTTKNSFLQRAGIDTFVTGDILTVVVTTTVDWTPVTANLDVSLEMVLNG